MNEIQKEELARHIPLRERYPLTDLAMWQQAESRKQQIRTEQKLKQERKRKWQM